MKRVRVLVIYGGPSPEHDVSVASARSVMVSLDRSRFAVQGLRLPRRRLFAFPFALLSRCDVIFPVGHGIFMEDGHLQAFLDTSGKPYVGSGVLASALAMDKQVSKRLFAAAGLPVTHWVTIKRRYKIVRKNFHLKFPVFVKPSNGGSSIGITRVGKWSELKKAIRFAHRYDSTALIEQTVPRAREIEVAVIGNNKRRASVPGEIIPAGEYYDYASKYSDRRTRLVIPAPLDELLTRRLQKAAVTAYAALGCRGHARVDFLLPRGSTRFVVSEINTIPGFTATSMFPKLWEASGIPYPQLLSLLISSARTV